MTVEGTWARRCGSTIRCNPHSPATTNSAIAAIRPTRTTGGTTGRTRLPSVTATALTVTLPATSPVVKYVRAESRQTGELSRYAELVLQVEPDRA
jgi:N-acetylmuramic acid 6-phosphate (MurNAc-6-P) etherase